MQQYKNIFIYGFAIFSMFFGSGNLVFPLQIGQESGAHWILGCLGLLITGIALPFLGLFVIKLHRGSYNTFFAEAGWFAKLVLPLFTLSLMASFGVAPRCITVAYGGITQMLPQMPLALFSMIFCAICFVFCLKDTFMIRALGKWMTPVLLAALAILIVVGVINAPALEVSDANQATSVFANGFLRGYQTMDLFAAFFFSSLIFRQIQAAMDEKASHKEVIRVALKPSLLGAGLLAVIYCGFVFLGAHYKQFVSGVAPELILPTIAEHALGGKSALIISIIIIFSCLTTGIALHNIYARYLCSLFKLPENKFPLMLLVTIVITFLVSLLKFQGIAAFLGPALELSYPSIIALTIMSILSKEHKMLKMVVFYGALVAMIMYRYVV